MLKWLMTLMMLSSVAYGSETFRCHGKLIHIGMTQEQVLKQCGPPTRKEVEDHAQRSGNRVVGTTHLNRWIYTHGTGRVTRTLEFDQDKLLFIK